MTLHRNVNVVLDHTACGNLTCLWFTNLHAIHFCSRDNRRQPPRPHRGLLQTHACPSQPAAAAATVMPTNAPAQPAPAADPHTAVANAMQALLKAPPYHRRRPSPATATTTQISGDMILPDQLHVTTQRSGKATKIIVAGGKAYLKLNDTWTVRRSTCPISCPASWQASRKTPPSAMSSLSNRIPSMVNQPGL